MKKLLGIGLGVISTVFLVAGLAGVVLLGSDSTYDSKATTLKTADAKVVVSTPGLVAFRDTTVRVRATNAGGGVFIGRAHPVDVASYLGGRSRYAVTSVDTSGLSGNVVKGDTTEPVADPTKQPFWTQRVTGAGTQSLTMKLDGSPTKWVIIPTGKVGALSVSSGVQIAGGFALSIGAIVLGLLGIAGLIVWHGRTRRRNRTEAATPAVTGGVTQPAQAAQPTPASPTAQSTSTTQRTMGRAVSLAAVVALVPALGGCAMIPSKAPEWKDDAVAKTAMTQAEAPAVMKDYDRRNNAAIKLSATKYDPKLWATADTGALLEMDRFDTAAAKATKDKSVGTFTHTAGVAYPASFTAYPMYTMLSATSGSGKEKSESLMVMTRERAMDPWRQAAALTLPAKSLPSPSPASDSTLSPQDLKQTQTAASSILTVLKTGKGSPALPQKVAAERAESRKTASSAAVAFFANGTNEVGATGPLQAVKTKAGVLAVATYDLSESYAAGTGMVFRQATKDDEYRLATGQAGETETLLSRQALTIAYTLDSKGTPKIIGHSYNQLPLG